MEILNNVIFKTEKKYLFENLKNSGVFTRNIDLLIFAISLGINHNEIKESSGSESVEINRSTLTAYKIRETLDFLFKTAILSCTTGSFDLNEEQRMKLAFDPEFSLDKFNKIKYLLDFASYGLDVIEKEVYSNVAENVIENISVLTKILLIKDNITEDILQGIITKGLQELEKSD